MFEACLSLSLSLSVSIKFINKLNQIALLEFKSTISNHIMSLYKMSSFVVEIMDRIRRNLLNGNSEKKNVSFEVKS